MLNIDTSSGFRQSRRSGVKSYVKPRSVLGLTTDLYNTASIVKSRGIQIGNYSTIPTGNCGMIPTGSASSMGKIGRICGS